jgi:succinate dehydrogenase / fumarate reductase membrane anchor subunit
MAEHNIATSRVGGTWPWFLQRLSAVLLLVFVGLHLFIAHFWHVGEEISVDNVSERLRDVAYIVVDVGMLVSVLFHGLNGLRTVLFDFDMFVKRKKMLDIGLLILGIATTIWGIVILLPFLEG